MDEISEFYDVVDSEGNVVETAAEQEAEQKGIPLQREQPPLTPGDEKKLRKLYVTGKHPRVLACHHRLDLTFQPRQRNCEHCWFAWFNNHGELVQQLDEMFQTQGNTLIIQLQGNKFYHRWRQFMATIAQLKQEQTNTHGCNQNTI